MQVPRPSDEDRDRFRAMVPAGDVDVRAMFGNLGAFVNGNMFLGLFGASVGVKVGDADRAELLRQPGAGPYGPAERPMGGWVALPAAWTVDECAPWVERAMAFVATFPPKPKARRGPTKRMPPVD
jgi:TfoX/Sxy family transcriptional regulator of competence genes